VGVVALRPLAARAAVGGHLERLAAQRRAVGEGLHLRGEGLRGGSAGLGLHGSLLYTVGRGAATGGQQEYECAQEDRAGGYAARPGASWIIRSAQPTRLRSVVTCE